MPVKDRLTGFKYYIENIEEFFQQRDSQLNDSIQATIQNGEDPSVYWWADSYWLAREVNLMRMSLFLSLYAFLEEILKELCYVEAIQRDITQKFTGYPGGNGLLDRFKSYITEVIEVDFSFGNRSSGWGYIHDYHTLRNHFAHKGLRLTREPEYEEKFRTLSRIIKSNPDLQHDSANPSPRVHKTAQPNPFGNFKGIGKKRALTQDGFLEYNIYSYRIGGNDIEIQSGFNKGVIDTIESFWEQLISEIQSANGVLN